MLWRLHLWFVLLWFDRPRLRRRKHRGRRNGPHIERSVASRWHHARLLEVQSIAAPGIASPAQALRVLNDRCQVMFDKLLPLGLSLLECLAQLGHPVLDLLDLIFPLLLAEIEQLAQGGRQLL